MPRTLSQASEQSSQIRCIAGSKPGVLDPSQRDRLLGGRGSTLSFAYQHPSTASESLVAPLPPEALEQSRVFVIETIGQEQTLCREVPGATLGPGIESEEPSRWPRTVYICGEPVTCSRDQWNIYKLDPKYRCSITVDGAYISEVAKVKEGQGPVDETTMSIMMTGGDKITAKNKKRSPSVVSQRFVQDFKEQLIIVDDADMDVDVVTVEKGGLKRTASASPQRPSPQRRPTKQQRRGSPAATNENSLPKRSRASSWVQAQKSEERRKKKRRYRALEHPNQETNPFTPNAGRPSTGFFQ